MTFDAIGWIGSRIPAASHLSKDTWDAVAAITIIWNDFENVRCGKKATIEKLNAVSAVISPTAPLPEPLNGAWEFWLARYVSAGDTNSLFDGLNFAGNHKKAEIRAILLKGDAAHSQERLFAILVIVYRLRNNLFHGEKEIIHLNNQCENLQFASSALAAIMDHVP